MHCTGKIRHATAELAQAALQQLLAATNDRHAAKRLAIYNCRYCKQFHVGHRRRRFTSSERNINGRQSSHKQAADEAADECEDSSVSGVQ